MSHLVPKDLKGEERLFVIPWINAPFYKKSILYNGPVTLFAFILQSVTNNLILFVSALVILNILVYPLGNSKIEKKKIDNGFMDRDMYIKKYLSWKMNKGGNVYVSHKIEGGK